MRTNLAFTAFAPLAAICICSTALAASEGWTSDFEAARKQAAEEKKDLLMNFTGSDWCGWCIRLKKEVFDQETFKEKAPENFVLVELDHPQDESLISDEVRKQNEELSKKYGIEGFPTLVLADAAGRPYATTGYREGGPEAYLKHLAELRGNKESQEKALEKAANAEGVEKARALVDFLGSLEMSEEMIANFYGEIEAQIRTADPADETGYQARRTSKEQYREFEEGLNQAFEENGIEGVAALVDEKLKDHKFQPEEAQKLTLTRAMVLAQQEKFDEALEAVDQAKALAPESDVAAQLDGFKEQLREAAAAKAGEAPDDE
jgi:thioredoxin-related protein